MSWEEKAGLWAVLALGWVAALAGVRVLSGMHPDSSCELFPGESGLGTPGWSWVPLGRTCTYELDPSIVFTTGPGGLPSLTGLALVLGASRLLRERRRAQHPPT